MADKKKAFSKELLQKKLDESAQPYVDSTEKMGSRLKQLLKNDIEEYKKREKTRAAEMISIFSAHNF